jgi:hypothetical protein
LRKNSGGRNAGAALATSRYYRREGSRETAELKLIAATPK